jgi:hypothetical protein
VKRRLIYLAIAAGVILLGLLWREPALGLPRVAAKYGGSMLWAAMVYFGLRAIVPKWPVVRVALCAAAIAAVGEFSQLISLPGFDEFRATTVGALIFGRTFDWPDIAAYWAGIALAALGDSLVQVRFRRNRPRGRIARR